MASPADLQKAKVQRRVLADGDFHEVACAVASDGVTCPVDELLTELQNGMWEDPAVDVYPDEYQVKHRYRLLALARDLAEGRDLPSNSFNFLGQGMWELKIESLRVTFYDTDGSGVWTEKCGNKVTETWDGKPRYELPEDFDEFIRFGHHFAKTGQKTEPADIRRAVELREEDVSHDKAAA